MAKKENVMSIKKEKMIVEALQIVYSYIYSRYTSEEVEIIGEEINEIVGDMGNVLMKESINTVSFTYSQIQKQLFANGRPMRPYFFALSPVL